MGDTIDTADLECSAQMAYSAGRASGLYVDSAIAYWEAWPV